jgi:hypothetical protein
LTQNFKQDWGNISPLLRQAFEHERYENMRKGDGKQAEIIILKKPALSVLLTGTPNQVVTLIRDTEDGLFSRFCYYNIEFNTDWKNVFGQTPQIGVSGTSLNQMLIPLQEEALSIYLTYHNEDRKEVLFELTKDQQIKHFNHFSELSKQHESDDTKNAIATIRRLGLICFRIAGILSALRQYKNKPQKLICADEDFESAILLTDLFILYASEVATALPKVKVNFLTGQKREFYEAMPAIEFTKGQAVEIAKGIGINEPAVEKYLRLLTVQGFFSKPAHNRYIKQK